METEALYAGVGGEQEGPGGSAGGVSPERWAYCAQPSPGLDFVPGALRLSYLCSSQWDHIRGITLPI